MYMQNYLVIPAGKNSGLGKRKKGPRLAAGKRKVYIGETEPATVK